MKATAQIKKQVEEALAASFPSALSLRAAAPPELLATGIAEVDLLLGGGMPLGAISELSGEPGSGRTTLALSLLAALTRQGESCALVDASDALDPVSAAAMGVALGHLLWVRVGEGGVEARQPRIRPPHIRPKEGRMWATETPDSSQDGGPSLRSGRHLAGARLEQALRATDLLLNVGGFRCIALDLGDVSAVEARRVPLATWYRFRLQAEKSRALFLLLTRQPCAHSCAALSVHCPAGEAQWQRAAPAAPLLLAGMRYNLQVERNRHAAAGSAVPLWRKPPLAASATHWRAAAGW
jgi:hypothetical protein